MASRIMIKGQQKIKRGEIGNDKVNIVLLFHIIMNCLQLSLIT